MHHDIPDRCCFCQSRNHRYTDGLCRELVQQRVQTVPSLHASYFIEQDIETRRAIKETEELDNLGRLSVAAIWPKIQRPSEATYYISGPPSMLQVISQDLRSMGIGAEAIKIDAWE